MRKLSLSELNRLDNQAFKKLDKTPIRLVLDDIRSALNVGSIFRTADAFAIEHIHLCGITAQPPHREIMKTAIGATQSVDWSYQKNIGQTLTDLEDAGFAIWAIEQAEGSTPLPDFTPGIQPVALVFGNEVSGVSQAVMDRVSGAIEVPQFGTKHSLNVAVCAGVVVWEVFRQMKWN